MAVSLLWSLMLLSKGSAVQHHGQTEVYVSLEGNDCERCGTISSPCQSIAMGIHQVDWGGHIYLDGTGTKRKPYHCNSTITHEQHISIKIQKSLTLIDLKSTPYISCPVGFYFDKSNTQTTSIILSGVVFRQTPLIFQDSDFKIFNCSFQDASKALRIRITDNARRHLEIHGSFFFNNNISCVEIILYHKDSNQNQLLAINISDTTFMENGFHRQRFPRGVVTIRSQNTLPSSSVHVQISCLNITSVNNVGYFMNLDLPSAVTSEVYDDVRLFNNTLSNLVKASSGRKTRNAVNSLYHSNTKKTRVKYNNLRCSHNHLLRCIEIHSEEAQAEIHNSSFVGQRLQNERGGAIFFNSTVHASVVIFNSKFRRNIAKGGGALFAHSKNGTLTLNMTKVNFTESAAEMYGCAVLVGDLDSPKVANRSTHKFYASIREMLVQDYFYFRQQCSIVRVFSSNGKVAITDSSWNSSSKALMISNAGGKTDVLISGCTFVVNAKANVTGSAVSIKAQKAQAKGRVLIENSVFYNQWVTARDRHGGALWMSPQFSIKLLNVVLASFAHSLRILGLYPKGPSDICPFRISISNCSFLDNSFDLLAHTKDPARVELSIENTIFKSSQRKHENVGLYIIIQPLGILNSSSAVIKINNVTFESRPCNFLCLLFKGNKTLQIQKSVFRNGVCYQLRAWKNTVFKTSTGAITVLAPPDKVVSTGCVKTETRKETHPVWSYRTHALFEDNIFEGNLGFIAGAVHVINGYTTFQRCAFRNNLAIEFSGHVYSAYGTGRVDFKDCFFSSTKKNITINDTTFHKTTFLVSESGGPINLQNTTMVSSAAESYSYPVIYISNGGFVYMDDNSTIQCGIGNKLMLDNATHFVYTEQNNSFCRKNVTVLKYSCNLCGPSYYSMEKGVSRGIVVNNTVECIQCPFGATCIRRNIAAKANFWGYPVNTNPPSLRFILCPEHYCQAPSLDSKVYNSCKGNRGGTLCGSCNPGYSETLFSAECRKNAECNNYCFWISIIVLTTGLALYLILKPPILVFLGNQILWFYRRDAYNQRDDLGQNNVHRDRGYIKVTFYFYQAAELLMVISVENILEKIPFIYIVIAVFNFQARTINKGLGCPFVGLTAVTKELLLSGTVFLTMADIALLYVVHSFINILRRKEKPNLLHYLAVFMEVLLLGYERLAETSLKLMQCVLIGPRKWLFIDANVPCMQWWQYLLLAYIIVFVAPFIVVLYWGSSKLYRASVTATEFLAACMIPLPYLIYWFVKGILNRRNGGTMNAQVVSKDVLEILHGPFREPQADDKGTLYWESVLIGRRFVLLACQAFITNLMLRMACMVSACFLITIHHILKNPYRDPLANKAETLSLGALSMIAVINLAKATLMSSGTAIDGPGIPYLEVLDWFQVCALGFVPVLISILLTFAILSQLARLVVFLIKLISQCWQKFRRTYCRPTAQERRALLYIAEQNSGTNSLDWE